MTSSLLMRMALHRCKQSDYLDHQYRRLASSNDVHSVGMEKLGPNTLRSFAQLSLPLGRRLVGPIRIGGWGPNPEIMKNYSLPSTMQWPGFAAA